MSIESTHRRLWVNDRASFGCGLGMTYPHQDGCGGVAGGTSPAPCPTPVALLARVCAPSRTSQGCYNPLKTMTSPMSSSGISISRRSLGTTSASVLRRLCVSGGFSSRRRFVRYAGAGRFSFPVGGVDRALRPDPPKGAQLTGPPKYPKNRPRGCPWFQWQWILCLRTQGPRLIPATCM